MFGSAYFGQIYPAQGYPSDAGVVVEFGDVIVASLLDGNPMLDLLDTTSERTMRGR
jgi:hypothetical protein